MRERRDAVACRFQFGSALDIDESAQIDSDPGPERLFGVVGMG
jgi:hypothetical protein